MKFGVSIPTCVEGMAYPIRFADQHEVVALGVEAEELGFDSVLVNDHVSTMPYVRARFADPPRFYEPLITLGYLAARTERIRMMTCVVMLPMREPVLLAKQAATLDQLSDGRLTLGIGVGAYRAEFESARPELAGAARGELVAKEHRAALEWLNAHTDPAIRFFGVRLAAVTLAGAPPGLVAPSLELVVKPNDWEKLAVAATSAAAAGSTTTQELYRQFWSEFEPLAKQRGWTNASASPQNWWSMPTGVAGASWSVSYATFGCRSELFFGHPDPAVNLARWHVLHDRKDDIESAFNGGLIFDDLPNNKGCRLEARLDGPKSQ